MIYTTQARVEAILHRSLSDDEADHIDEMIASVSDSLSFFCNRSFQEVTDDTDDLIIPESLIKNYDGNGKKELQVDDFTSLLKVTFLDTQGTVVLEFTPTDNQFILNPPNRTVKSSIYLRNYRFLTGVQNIEVEAIWGSGLAPLAVVRAASELVAKLILKNTALNEGFKSESIEGYSYQLQTGADIDSDTEAIMDTLRPYKKIVL